MSEERLIRYDATTIALHWATAISVLALWTIGQTADMLPHKIADGIAWPIHVVWGFALVALVAWRVIWRAMGGADLPAADTGFLQCAAKTIHYLLYALLAATLVLGVVNAFVRGYDVFGLFSLPQIGERAWRRPITQWHELAANALLVLALLHTAAALAHHYLLRDGVLRRMLPAPGEP